MSYIGIQQQNQISPQFSREVINGDGSATQFTLIQDVPGFNADNIMVVVNNVIQEPVAAYTIKEDANGNPRVLDFGTGNVLSTTDECYVQHRGVGTLNMTPAAGSVNAAALQDNLRSGNVDSFTATAGQTAFTLTETPLNAQSISVFVNGIYQKPTTNFTVSGTTLTLTAGAVAGDEIDVIHHTIRTTVTHVADKAVTSSKLDTNIQVAGTLGVTGNVTASADLSVGGNLTVSGTTTTIDTTIENVDKLEVGANSSDYGAKINQAGSGNILQLQDGGTDVMVVADGGKVGIGTASPASFRLEARANAGGTSETDTIVAITNGNDSSMSDGLLNIKNAGNRGTRNHGSGSPLIKAQFSDATAFEVKKDGNLTIGGGPAEQLTLDGESGVNSGYVGWKGDGSHIGFIGGGSGLGASATDFVVRGTNNVKFNIGTSTKATLDANNFTVGNLKVDTIEGDDLYYTKFYQFFPYYDAYQINTGSSSWTLVTKLNGQWGNGSSIFQKTFSAPGSGFTEKFYLGVTGGSSGGAGQANLRVKFLFEDGSSNYESISETQIVSGWHAASAMYHFIAEIVPVTISSTSTSIRTFLTNGSLRSGSLYFKNTYGAGNVGISHVWIEQRIYFS